MTRLKEILNIGTEYWISEKYQYLHWSALFIIGNTFGLFGFNLPGTPGLWLPRTSDSVIYSTCANNRKKITFQNTIARYLNKGEKRIKSTEIINKNGIRIVKAC